MTIFPEVKSVSQRLPTGEQIKVEIRNYKLKNIRASLLGAVCCMAAISGAARAQTGGTYRIERSVIAAGGRQSSIGGTFALDGTVGQATVGQTRGAPYALDAGFWTPTGFAPTAAGVTLGGRVTTADGRGILNARMTLIGADGAARTALTSAFGFYSFTNTAAGETYIVSVAAKRFRFAQNTQILSAIGDDTSINFVTDFDPVVQMP